MTVNRSDFQKGRLASVSAADTIIVNDEDGTLEPQVIDFAGLAASAPFTGAFWPNSSTALTGAGLANDDRIPVLDGSVPKYITADQLAQMPQLSSRYKPLASDRWWINANEFVVLAGSPSLGTLNSGATAHERTGVYLFDASTAEVVGAAFAPPPGWTTFTANIYWSNAGAGSGDVMWTVFGLALGDGDSSASVSWQGSNVTATAPAQNVVEVTAAGTTFTVSSGKIHRINFRRAATDAADTLGNDAALIGIELVRAS